MAPLRNNASAFIAVATTRKATKARDVNYSDILDCLKPQLRDEEGLEGPTAVRARSRAVDTPPILGSSLDASSNANTRSANAARVPAANTIQYTSRYDR